MIDPLPRPPTFISSLTQPIADVLSLQTLPLHAHEVLLAFTIYYLMDTILAPRVSSQFFPKTYSSLPLRSKINWNIRVVSTIQAIFICGLAFWVVLADEERKNMNLEERVWGYTGALGMTQAFAAGYFIWDVKISATNVGTLGWGSLAHAVSALLITSLGFVSLVIFHDDVVELTTCGLQASIRELLWCGVCPLCHVDSFLEPPLVLRQVQHDRWKGSASEWHCPLGNLLRIPTCMGDVPVGDGVPGHLGGSPTKHHRRADI